MTLRLRLNILISIIMMMFTIVLSIVLILASKQSIEEGVEGANKVTLQLLDSVIMSSVQNPEWGDTHLVMQRFLEDLGHVRSNRISLYDLQGTLLYKSPPSTYRLNTNPPNWFIKFLAPPNNVNTRLIRFGRLIVETNPIGTIKEAWVEMSRLFFITIVFLIALNIFVYFLLGRWLQPINPMLKAIEKMGKGKLSIRLPQFKLPEFNSISTNFNRMGESLELSIKENQTLASIAEQTADAIIMQDKDNKISFWNHSAELMFGFNRADALGRPIDIIFPKDRKKNHTETFLSGVRGKGLSNFEAQGVTKKANLIDISISSSSLKDQKTKRFIGNILSIRDISEKIIAEQSQKELRRNRELTAIIQGHIEDERRSLARELHDELGQYVSAVKIFAQNIINRSKGKDKNIEESALSVTSAANQIYDGMHSIIRQLRPGSLDNLGLAETLKDMVSGWRSQHSAINIDLFVGESLGHLGEAISINVYRIIQEAMNNCLKHAEAKNISISLDNKKKQLALVFKDDGVGFDTTLLAKTKQFGLIGMQERVKSLNGIFSIKSNPNKGTLINITIPLDN
ncbi:MAG: PAS domain S-box protein [Nitrosomonadales bacterium]|nr:PAS domain S-box protein [Nitrosomonadales bacterium]MBT6140575.1 PAS domain S-box protein [Nitrosomonadales bacterium]MDA7751195.1 PAS domain S-box protein [Methylophilaceae bacterium]MDA9087616.1 PAS domain S-box protein [Methylophilaceae bacterium]MDC1281082.1 PAS domain S-box protein [Methylophilaceae bacterium]